MRDVSGNVRTLSFVWHDTVVHRTVLVGVHETVVVVVTRPERSDGTGTSKAASLVWEGRLVIGPQVALNVGVTVVDEVHRTTASELDTVVAVVTVVGGTEVLELESSRDVDVGVTLVLVRVPVVGRDTVVEVRSAVRSTGHGRLGVGHFCEALVEGFPCVVG